MLLRLLQQRPRIGVRRPFALLAQQHLACRAGGAGIPRRESRACRGARADFPCGCSKLARSKSVPVPSLSRTLTRSLSLSGSIEPTTSVPAPSARAMLSGANAAVAEERRAVRRHDIEPRHRGQSRDERLGETIGEIREIVRLAVVLEVHHGNATRIEPRALPAFRMCAPRVKCHALASRERERRAPPRRRRNAASRFFRGRQRAHRCRRAARRHHAPRVRRTLGALQRLRELARGLEAIGRNLRERLQHRVFELVRDVLAHDRERRHAVHRVPRNDRRGRGPDERRRAGDHLVEHAARARRHRSGRRCPSRPSPARGSCTSACRA